MHLVIIQYFMVFGLQCIDHEVRAANSLTLNGCEHRGMSLFSDCSKMADCKFVVSQDS